MRATPPSRRMSAGTRSSAMTAQAPASSAIRACSAVTTSMMTPPLSICARPALTANVPTTGSFVFPFSCLPLTGVFVSELIVRFSFALIRPPLPCPSVPNANSALISFGAHAACAPVLETSSLTPLRRYIVGMNHSFTKISASPFPPLPGGPPSRGPRPRSASSRKGSGQARRRAQPAPTRVRMRPPHHTVLRASLAPSSIDLPHTWWSEPGTAVLLLPAYSRSAPPAQTSCRPNQTAVPAPGCRRTSGRTAPTSDS